MTDSAQRAGASLERLLEVIGQLREHCPWMGALTHESLAEYLVEECYELLEVLEGTAGADDLRSELGDVLLQVVLHARLQEEQGPFAMADVIDGLTEKMIRRNAHIFMPDGGLRDEFPASVEEIEAAWHSIKRQEQPVDSHPFASIPPGLPALASAAKTLKRARREAGSAPEPAAVVVRSAGAAPASGSVPASGAVPASASVPASEEELGEVLLAVVGRAVDAGLDPERALRLAVRRYQEAHAAP
ncbi:MazG nucleotide pyrophosphohydrolase domain-containing protein [Arthrobacter subterraneus]|uniref:MazG nucleotide pyrophosphohydrolase domain-containing protein n=1 Tax=Arthrobacter subterraneus TaxID=335973 RepID=UPI00380E5611